MQQGAHYRQRQQQSRYEKGTTRAGSYSRKVILVGVVGRIGRLVRLQVVLRPQRADMPLLHVLQFLYQATVSKRREPNYPYKKRNKSRGGGGRSHDGRWRDKSDRVDNDGGGGDAKL